MFTGVNIESSATCNLRCAMCPTRCYPSHTRNGYMDTKTFVLSRPSLDDLPDGIDLTGWGEPLMNPYLPAFIESVEGVTFTTNGLLLNNRAARMVVLNKVGAVAISIDAASEDTFDKLHPPGDFGTVWRNIEGLSKLREREKSPYPTISAHFLLMKSNVRELSDFVQMAADVGADEVVVKHVALFCRPGYENEVLYTGFFEHVRPDEDLRDESVKKAVEKARAAGIPFRKIGVDHAEPVAGCFGGAITRPFVAVDGYVSPCCVLAHEAPRLKRDGTTGPASMLFFGNIHENTLEEIWKLPEYVEFRSALKRGDPPPQCRNCLGHWSVTLDI